MVGHILGIDPGSEQSAACLIDSVGVVDVEARIVEVVKLPNGRFMDWVLAQIDQKQSALSIGIEGLVNQGRVVGRETFDTAYMIGRLFRILESRPADQRIEFDLYTKQETAAWLVGSSSGKADAVVREGLMNRYGPYTNGPLQALKGDGSDRRTAFLIAKYHEYCLFEKSKGVVGFRRSVYTPLSYEEPKRGRK